MRGIPLQRVPIGTDGDRIERLFVRKEGRSSRDRLQFHPPQGEAPPGHASRRESLPPYFTLPSLAAAAQEEPWLCHGLFTRLGGVSEGYLGGLNVGSRLGDEPAFVEENFRRIGYALGMAPAHMVLTLQEHSTEVRQVTAEDAGKGVTKPQDFGATDALISDVPGLLLGAYTADCVPLLFADPVHRAVGIAHAGWRGTVGQIGPKVVAAMGEAYGTEPRDLYCGIAPSICQDCYEVEEDVAGPFREAFPGHEECILRGPLLPEGAERPKYYLDLWTANRLLLEEAGVSTDRISTTDLCTCCQPGLFFSHRASGGKRGLNGSFIGLR